MANPLKLPFDFPPNAKPTTHQLQANFDALLQFVQNLNDGVTSLTNLLVTNFEATGTAEVDGAITSNSVIKLADGSVTVPSLQLINSPATGAYRRGANSLGIATDATNVWGADSDGNISQPVQPSFLARASGGQSISTSTPGGVTVTFTNEVFDTAGNYDTTTSTFTAPITGYYHLFFNIYTDWPAGSLPLDVGAYINTSNRRYCYQTELPSVTNGNFTFSMSVLADMDAGDTATIGLYTGGVTASVLNAALGVVGTPGNSIPVNFFMGTLIN